MIKAKPQNLSYFFYGLNLSEDQDKETQINLIKEKKQLFYTLKQTQCERIPCLSQRKSKRYKLRQETFYLNLIWKIIHEL